MAVSSAAVSVTTSATALDQTDTSENGSQFGQSLLLRNNGSQTVYLGGSAVSTANGYPLGVGEEKAVRLDSSEKIYGIVAATTCEVRVLAQAV